jgi:methyltransferase family protein
MSSRTAVNPGSGDAAKPYGGYYKYNKAVARTYEQDREGELHWQQENDFVAQHFADRDINSLLDVPVGTGRFFPYYGRVARVVGVDISEEMLNQARGKVLHLSTRRSIQLERGDIFDLRFSDRHFDVAIVWRLFHLLPMNLLAPAVRELCRVTKNELVVQTYTPVEWWRTITEWLSLFFRSRKSPNDQFSPCPTRSSPWSHIPAYYHKQSLIDSLFCESGFHQSKSHILSRYGNCWVRANVYLRLS